MTRLCAMYHSDRVLVSIFRVHGAFGLIRGEENLISVATILVFRLAVNLPLPGRIIISLVSLGL